MADRKKEPNKTGFPLPKSITSLASDRPYSQACENNKQAILEVMGAVFRENEVSNCLEIGSGTGQHVVHFAQHLPNVKFYPTDQLSNLPGILAWVKWANLKNIETPVELDVRHWESSPKQYTSIYSANTSHIMSWDTVCVFMSQVSTHLEQGGLFLLYGPFNFDGKFTSESNERFDKSLKSRNSGMGLRNFEDMNEILLNSGMTFSANYECPANNRLLIWRKQKLASEGRSNTVSKVAEPV
eukprot:GHVN01018446.1.p1 GENE.GHVN01018446.1~~GHVN01018446.1.p1  ORF type:complete len:241 (+),score=26.59 GHVN01018446.1:250-972(+)